MKVHCFLLSLWCVTSNVQSSGVYFVERNDVYYSYNSWLVTFSIDLTQYESQINNLRETIDEFYLAFQDILKPFSTGENVNKDILLIHNDITKFLYREMKQIDRSFDDVLSRYNEINTVVTKRSFKRSKRALIPFGGKVLSYLFGTATESNLRTLKKTLLDVSTKQYQVIHVLENSVSILNTTHSTLQENRQMLNKITNATIALRNELTSILDKISNEIMPEITYLELLGRLNSMYHIVSATLNEFKYVFDVILLQIQQCVQGQLPISLFKPSLINSVLSQIQNNVNKQFSLPYSLKSFDSLSYYKHLQPLVIAQNSKLHIVIAIPIIPNDSQFTVYEAIKLPFTHPKLELSAIYDIEYPFIAISKDEKHYTFLGESDMRFCKEDAICKISSPVFDIVNYPSCLINLYLRDSLKIEEYCSLKLSKVPLLPIAKFLKLGKWLVSSPIKFNLQIDCKDSSLNYVKEINIGITDIQLENDCSAECQYFKLPTYESGKIDIENQKLQIESEIKLNKLSSDLWNESKVLNTVSRKMNSSVDELEILKHISDIPIDSFHSILKNYPRENMLTNISHYYDTLKYVFMFIIVSIVIILCIWFIYKAKLLSTCANVFSNGQQQYRTNVNVQIPQLPPPEPIANTLDDTAESIEFARFLRP